MPKKKKVVHLDNTPSAVALVDVPKKDRLNHLLREINKTCGQSVIHFGDEELAWTKQPTGVKPVDDMLGGGIPYGRFTTVWGSPGCGKTSLAYSTAAQAQKDGKVVYFIALESFDIDRAKLFGVDVDKLVIGRFPKAEQSLDTIIKLAKEKAVDVIILDSIQALSPKNEQEEKSGAFKSTENDTMALLARKLSQFFRMALDPVHRGNVAVLLIGQTRTNVGYIAFEQLSGGNALKHSSKLIIQMRRGQKADAPHKKIKTKEGKTENVIIGFDCVFILEKVQSPNCKTEGTKLHLPFIYEEGFKYE